jgi:hypothetical protein
MEFPCGHLPVSSMRSSPALLILPPGTMGDGHPAAGVPLANQGLAPLSLARSQSAYFARLHVFTLD